MDKKALRAEYRRLRDEIPTEEKASMDQSICRLISQTPEFQKAETVLLYYPIKGEIDLLPLVALCRRSGKEVGFPISKEDGTLAFRSLAKGERLTTGAYGIPEPSEESKPSTINEKTLCILPGLSFDKSGNRLGYGKGYYDRFLEHFPGMTLGAAYSKALAEELPTDAHDRPVDTVVCENGVIVCNSDLHQKSESRVARMRSRLTDALSHRLKPIRDLIHRRLHPSEANTDPKSNLHPRTGAPILVLATYLHLQKTPMSLN